MISHHFLNTKYIKDIELSVAVERHNKKECVVVPIVISACGWDEISMLSKFSGIPRKGHNISSWRNNKEWSNRNDAWFHVFQEVKKLIAFFK